MNIPASTTKPTKNIITATPSLKNGAGTGTIVSGNQAAGLPQPGKSSCFFCPSMKKQEILYLKEHYPDLFNRAATLEENAMPYLKTVKGLGAAIHGKNSLERSK